MDEWGYYHSESLDEFHRKYSTVHGYLAFALCGFGIAANMANIVVFTRRHMISPTHTILTALAAADMLMMLSYMIFKFQDYIRQQSKNHVPSFYGRAVINLANLNFYVVAWTVSNWTTIAVAVFRVVSVRCPAGAATWCSTSRAKCAIAVTCLGVAVCCIPFYIAFTVTPLHEEAGYQLVFSPIAQRNDYLLLRIIPWYQVVLRLVPCVALTVLSCLLCTRQHDSTTRMLLAVFLLTLLAELPLILLHLLGLILDSSFAIHVQFQLTSVLEAVMLINKGFKFAIYCLLSRQFRNTLFPSKVVSARRRETDSDSAAMTANTVI